MEGYEGIKGYKSCNYLSFIFSSKIVHQMEDESSFKAVGIE